MEPENEFYWNLLKPLLKVRTMTNIENTIRQALTWIGVESPERRKNRIIQNWIQCAQETIGTHDMSFHCLECGEAMIGCKPSPGSSRPMPCCPECQAVMEVTSDDVLNGMLDVTELGPNVK